MRTARCGHPATARRGPVGYCDRCRPLGELVMRLRQAAVQARILGLRSLARDLRAIARDPAARERQLTAEAARSSAQERAADGRTRPAPPPRSPLNEALDRAGLLPASRMDDRTW